MNPIDPSDCPNPNSPKSRPFTRRRFLQSALVSGTALTLASVARGNVGSGRKLRAIVLERKDFPGLLNACAGHLPEAVGAKQALSKAGFAVEELNLARPFREQSADVLVLGSYVSCHDDVVQYLEENGAAIQNFCREGGIVVQLAEAPPYTEFQSSSRPRKETSPFFLPNTLIAKRTRETFWDLYVREPEHPLLAGMELREDGGIHWDLSERWGHNASWMPVGERRGFRVLVSNTEDDSRAALIEAPHGKGRYILASIFLDKLLSEDGEPRRPVPFIAEAERFFANLHTYAEELRTKNVSVTASGGAYADPAPAGFVEGSFTIVLIPDTQYYCQDPSIVRHLDNLTDWIVRERDALNIQYVLHLGDLVNRGGREMHQWNIISAAVAKLDGQVPYAIALGNHDYTDDRSTSRATPLNDFFPPSRCSHWPTFGGVMTPGHMENNWHTFRAHDTDFLILCLEFGPRDEVLAWANQVVAQHPNHRVLLNTHAYMYSDSRRYDKKKRGAWQIWNPVEYQSEGGNNDAQDIWEKLIDRHDNFFLVANGHVINDGLGRKTSRTRHGNDVHQMLFNYQGYYQGGSGTIRLLHFLPDRKTVQVRTCATTGNRFHTGPQEQFQLTLTPPLAGGA